jgi:acetyl esterase/lipase
MKYIILASLLITTLTLSGQQIIPLYEGEIPNSKPTPDEEKTEVKNGMLLVSKISRPTLAIYLPPAAKATGAAVVICPGGGYWVNAIGHEGVDIAKKFNEMGVAAFVLKYRIPSSTTMIDRTIGPLQDAQQAIKVVRQRAKEWNVNAMRIGIMGFSAGGHLASTAGTHYDSAFIDNPNKISLRPNFMILVYPVISLKAYIAHKGSVEQLLGKKPSKALVEYYSNELHIKTTTPPTFLVHASDDNGVKPINSILFYENLIKKKVPAELHIYQKGGHGFGLDNKSTHDQWMDRCRAWMESNGWLEKK